MEKAIFAAGCFWGVEHDFRAIPGVAEAIVGYTGGHTEHPTYEQVCTGRTGHAEAVEVSFDPLRVSYDRLLDAFWALHDPTTPNRQGPDSGTQYRSGIFYLSEAQHAAAERSKAAKASAFSRPIVTEITPASTFWKAEDYHQRYFSRRAGALH
jgi:peptide-methionine (S)-S-oxide reductase